MPWNPDRPTIPIDPRTGWMAQFAYRGDQLQEVEPFMAELQLYSYSRGRSSISIEFLNCESGERYYMFVSDFIDLCKKVELDRGRTRLLQWTYTKKGMNYGIKLAE